MEEIKDSPHPQNSKVEDEEKTSTRQSWRRVRP